MGVGRCPVEGLELMSQLENHYRGKRVLLTGHTGFKGSWMAEWLLSLGADVAGIALEPDTTPAIFEQLGLAGRMEHHVADIRDADRMKELIGRILPDVVFHLAAQPLVRYSYDHPLETFQTNVMGTANVLDALRSVDHPCQVVVVTTDKCYENKETNRPYEEHDPMGGYDPYSASKGACELVVSSYRRSFFNPEVYGHSHQVALATARAGNVIGGGDWALDRIVPGCMRALENDEPISVRNPDSTRPWQHVLEPLGGYLRLGMLLAQDTSSNDWKKCCSGFNFGPDPEANRPVRDLVDEIIKNWPGKWLDRSDPNAVHEAELLSLDIDKAARLLDWSPVWSFETAIARTVEWYRNVLSDPAEALACTEKQIAEYMEIFDYEI